MRPLPKFASADDEVRFLRGLVAVHRMADAVIEDCLERQLGLSAAADVFLTQCARMIHATGAALQLDGTSGPVLTRTWGSLRGDVSALATESGVFPQGDRSTLFVAPLNLGRIRLGALGFVLPGTFDEGVEHVVALVDAIAEMFDTSVLAFLAVTDGQSPLQRLDELGQAHELEPAARVGRYALMHPLGSGGMAQVMVARTVGPEGISRLVALKRILPHLATEPAIVEQFLDEAKLGLKLTHPNLVTTYDFGQANGSFFIAMELIRGVDFDHVIYSPYRPLEPALVSAVLVQALEGLHAAHDVLGDDGHPLGLVHRDLSPHNLMVGFDGRVKVLDFGVAKMREQRTVTLPGLVKGKPLYMSPEQACAERVDRRSDVFSMGLILFEALTGRRAFVREDDTKTMLAIVNEALSRPQDVSQAWWEVLSRALAKDPNARYRSAHELALAIADVASPMPAAQLGNFVSQCFPERVALFSQWGRTGSRPGLDR